MCVQVMMNRNKEAIDKQGFQISDFIQGDTGSQITNAMLMLDKFTASDAYKSIKKYWNVFVSQFKRLILVQKYAQCLFQDCLAFTVAVVATDALFRSVFQNQ